MKEQNADGQQDIILRKEHDTELPVSEIVKAANVRWKIKFDLI